MDFFPKIHCMKNGFIAQSEQSICAFYRILNGNKSFRTNNLIGMWDSVELNGFIVDCVRLLYSFLPEMAFSLI